MQKKLKIYTVADSFLPHIGGMEKVAQFSATELAKNNDSMLFAPKVKGYEDNLPVKVFRVKSIPIQKPVLMFATPNWDGKFKKFVKQNPPDIIHVHNQAPLSRWFLKYGKKHNIPTFMTIHGYIENDIDATKFKPLKKFIKNYFFKTIGLADTLFAVSNGNKQYYENYGFKPVLLRNGIDELVADETFSNEIKKKYDINQNDNVLCFVNRLIEIKNVFLMIDALKILKEKGFHFKALIAGDGNKKQELEELVKNYDLENCVFFLGNISNRSHVASIYKISDINLFPSVKDNSSLSIGESASQNTPTLAMEKCSSVELIKDTQNGFLSKNEADAYARTIIEIFENKDKLKTVGQKAKETLYFSWADYEKQVLEFYRKSLENKNHKQ